MESGEMTGEKPGSNRVKGVPMAGKMFVRCENLFGLCGNRGYDGAISRVHALSNTRGIRATIQRRQNVSVREDSRQRGKRAAVCCNMAVFHRKMAK